MLAALAVGTLTHVLLTGVRRRRRDLAVLKALGLTRAQLQGAVAWEATALAAAALLVGDPAGIDRRPPGLGRLRDRGRGGRPARPSTWRSCCATIPATLLLANVIAAWPRQDGGPAAARDGAARGVMGRGGGHHSRR